MDSFFSLTPSSTQMLLLWSGAILFFTILEIATPALVSIWFVLGSIAALIAFFCGASFVVQLFIFLGVTAVSLIFCRPMVKVFLRVVPEASNANALIGMKGVVIETINNIQAKGYVKVSGLEYRAKSVNDEEIESDSVVQVERIEGNTLFVTKA